MCVHCADISTKYPQGFFCLDIIKRQEKEKDDRSLAAPLFIIVFMDMMETPQGNQDVILPYGGILDIKTFSTNKNTWVRGSDDTLTQEMSFKSDLDLIPFH